jgi:hypothetical protein
MGTMLVLTVGPGMVPGGFQMLDGACVLRLGQANMVGIRDLLLGRNKVHGSLKACGG